MWMAHMRTPLTCDFSLTTDDLELLLEADLPVVKIC